MCRLSLFGARISFHRSEFTLGFAPFPWSVSVKKLFKIHTQQSFWTWKENIPSRIAKGRRTSEPMIFKVRAEVLDWKFDQWYATKSCVAWCNVGHILITEASKAETFLCSPPLPPLNSWISSPIPSFQVLPVSSGETWTHTELGLVLALMIHWTSLQGNWTGQP